MKKAYVVPHPPIILPEVGRGEEEKISETIKAYKKIAKEIGEIRPETIIISSPHAPYYSNAFYMGNSKKAKGDLKAFGVFDVEESAEIDRELCQEILKTGHGLPIYYTENDADKLDHGSLIPLRFIKEVYSDFKIAILGISTLSGKAHYGLGKAIARAVENLGRSCVYIASGDLSHVLKDYGPYGFNEAGPIFDKKIVDILERGAFDELLEISSKEADQAAQCGLGSFQIMAGFFDGFDVKAEKYSYEGPFGVGYTVISFTGGEKNPDRKFLQQNRNRKVLDPYIELARETIDKYIKENKIIDPPSNLPKNMLETRAGCFVSLHKFGELRGCIGTIGPTRKNLAEEIIENAISASTRDPRFPAVFKDELEDLEISVDILDEAEPVASMEDLDAKKYGVIVTSGFKRGLLLPNLEGVNRPEEQIDIALQKAGIGPDEDYKLERFEVIRHEYKK
jgi:AmmeMemoRadiSam system protein A/AmmeMemoRadiSam system protein B